MHQPVSFACRLLVWAVACTWSAGLLAAEPNSPRVEFNRDIRPILSDKCFTCHGPDSAKRQAGLRLDRAEAATAERDGPRAIVPRDAAKSEVVRRIVSRDPDEQMPPPKSNLSLTPKEVSLIRQWIEQGAEYQPHWAFLAPRAVVPPAAVFPSGGRESPGSSPADRTAISQSVSPIDAFICAKLTEHNLAPSPAADKPTLLRRASFDLIGLPPTPNEVDEFVADSSPDAFEKQIDRLLASPRYGERMATIWLDAARYADTNGYQTDGPRFMWRYRDWVINAFNRNQPFDEFTIHQLAGDLMESGDASGRGTSPVPSPPSSGERVRVRGPSVGKSNDVQDASTGLQSGESSEEVRTPHPNPLPSKARGEGTGRAAAPTIANDRLIATGFNRNHRGNAEGGIIPEEFRVEYVVDRVETTSTVWLGLTIGCARCHDHKYDPISQREFYQLFAFFNQVPEPGKYIRNGNSMPYLPAPTADQQLNLTALEREADAARAAWDAKASLVNISMTKLAAEIADQEALVDWSFGEGLDSHIAFDGNSLVGWASSPSGSTPKNEEGRAGSPSYKQRDATWHDGAATFTAGQISQAAEFDGKRWLDAGDVGDFGEDESFAISCWVKPRGRGAMTILARMDHDNASRGYELRIEESGRLQALFSGRILDDLIRVETKEPLATDRWSHVFVSYDGSSAARGVSIRVNGETAKLTVITDLLSNPIRVKLPLIIGAGGSAQPFVGLIDELRLYRSRLTEEVAMSLAAGETISQIATGKLDDFKSPTHLAKLREFYLSHHAPEAERRARQNVLDTRSRYEAYLATIPTTMVMQDVPGLRETRILTRGEYNKPGEVVQTGVPAVFGKVDGRGLRVEGQQAAVAGNTVVRGSPDPAQPATEGLPASPSTFNPQPLTRLDLARWLVSPENPLAARVTVNRLWQMLFGTGLVKTSEDFGTQGESPSHPELLDWLAVEFGGTRGQGDRETGGSNRGGNTQTASLLPLSPDPLVPLSGSPRRWDIKRTLRQLVTTATYRQSSRLDEALLAHDPDNRWLARGPRFRLTAEMIRDAALASSGLLVESLGGPSVKPYQPAGLWEELSAEAVPGPFSVYVQDHGAGLYRRSLYTYQKRTVTTPSMAIFDASSRDFCRVKLPRTNTPLQALNLMNDITYLEAARVLAEHALREGGASAESRIAWAFRRALSRPPSDTELSVLVRGFDRRLSLFRNHPESIQKLLLVGESRVDEMLSAHELAAFTTVTSEILSLDETVNRN